MAIHIDDNICTGCGICSAVCPMNIFNPAEGSSKQVPPEERTGMCISCGHCEAFCPTGALIRDQPGGVTRKKSWDGEDITQDKLSAYLISRRSIRKFKPGSVPRETIETILDVARYAASGCNGQPVEWLVIHDPEETRKIAGLTIDWMRTLVNTDHPMGGFVHGLIDAWENGSDPICLGAPHLLIPHIPEGNPTAPIDAIIALTHFDISAPVFQIGTCWAGFVMAAAQSYAPLVKALDLPEGRTPAYAMMFGFPRYSPSYVPGRKPLQVSWK